MLVYLYDWQVFSIIITHPIRYTIIFSKPIQLRFLMIATTPREAGMTYKHEQVATKHHQVSRHQNPLPSLIFITHFLHNMAPLRLSCDRCRSHKQRCSGKQSDTGSCQRCQRVGIECKFSPTRRIGRPFNNRTQGDFERDTSASVSEGAPTPRMRTLSQESGVGRDMLTGQNVSVKDSHN